MDVTITLRNKTLNREELWDYDLDSYGLNLEHGQDYPSALTALAAALRDKEEIENDTED